MFKLLTPFLLDILENDPACELSCEDAMAGMSLGFCIFNNDYKNLASHGTPPELTAADMGSVLFPLDFCGRLGGLALSLKASTTSTS